MRFNPLLLNVISKSRIGFIIVFFFFVYRILPAIIPLSTVPFCISYFKKILTILNRLVVFTVQKFFDIQKLASLPNDV